jgi:hypothetical protein
LIGNDRLRAASAGQVFASAGTLAELCSHIDDVNVVVLTLLLPFKQMVSLPI